jgi:predicted phage-related endonuclease
MTTPPLNVVVDHSAITRAEWLKQRGTFVGASEISSILGLPGAYATMAEVWLSKVCAQEQEETEEEAAAADPETADRLDDKSMGLILEPSILTMYERRNPTFKVRRNGLQIWRHPNYPFIGATLDAEAETEFGDLRTVEAKRQRYRDAWGDEGTDEVPAIFAAQGVQQMLVREHLGYATFCDFPVLFSFFDFKVFSVAYDAKLAGQIIEVLSIFWNMVEKRTPPEVDFSKPGAAKLMRQVYNRIVGETLTLEAGSAHNQRALALIYTSDYADGEAKAWEARKEEAQAELLAIAGDFARVEIPVFVDGKEKTIAINRKEQKGYPVPARYQEPIIKTTFEPYHLKKRREIFDALEMIPALPASPTAIEGESE